MRVGTAFLKCAREGDVLLGEERVRGPISEELLVLLSAGLCYSTSEPQIPCLVNGGLISDCRKD